MQVSYRFFLRDTPTIRMRLPESRFVLAEPHLVCIVVTSLVVVEGCAEITRIGASTQDWLNQIEVGFLPYSSHPIAEVSHV